jgi:hypothetical protein
MSGQSTASGSVAASFGWLGHPWVTRAGLLMVAVLAFAVGLLVGDGVETARAVAADPDLALLLRAMAGLKALMAVAAVGVMVWRLGSPIGAVRLGFYGVAAAAMAAGPALIWGLVHVGWGAGLLHAGLLGAVVLLWRDPEVGARLQGVIEGRRAALRGR